MMICSLCSRVWGCLVKSVSGGGAGFSTAIEDNTEDTLSKNSGPMLHGNTSSEVQPGDRGKVRTVADDGRSVPPLSWSNPSSPTKVEGDVA